MAGHRVGVADVQGVWAIMPTPSKPNAEDPNARDTVDLDETTRVVKALIDSGANGILTLGSLGEVATLTWDEKRDFMKALVEVAGGRVPVFGGTSTLSTRTTIDETRAARDIGVDGTMVGPPMWCAPDVPTAVQFYRDLAEACPDMSSEELLAEIASELGWEPDAFLAYVHSEEAEDAYRLSNEEAHSRGVFGAPIMMIGEEMWWGSDRLFFLDEYLSSQ
uniref:Uncharacterized protein ORF2 n=1 Tax=Sphingomonas sp. A4 TaxID=223555 RepID=Q6BDD1_9SPHN|nr:hypothetical protein [Sphingomonas sp. A4]BAE93948.1 hypothetical protein [Sphingomonas sp. A4]